MKAEKIFNKALEIAKEGNDFEHLHIYADSVKYSKKLKLQIIEVAKKNGYNWELDNSRLYNSYSKRYFTCNNIIRSK